MRLRSLMCLGLLLCLSCDALFGAFSLPNPKNCVQNASMCSAGEICDPISERCAPIRPDFDFFAVQTSTHEQEARHVLAGNFDGDDQPDVLLVGSGTSSVLYNVGSTLDSRRTFTSNSRPGTFYALATRVNADLLDDLVLVTEKGDTSQRFGTIEFCEARGPKMTPPFACGTASDLQFIPKAVLLLDILDDPLPELVAVDDKGGIKVCRAVSVSGMQGVCQDIQVPTNNAVSYAQLALLDDVNGDGRPDVGVLTGWQASAPALQILRSAGGQSPTLSNSILPDLGFPVLVAGNFRQNNSPCVALIGTKGGNVTVYPYCDLQQGMPTPLPEVVTAAKNLRGDPVDVNAAVVGQFDGVGGSKADDIALQMIDNSTVFALGSTNGLVLDSQTPGSFVKQPATHLVTAAFSHAITARSDVFMYNDPHYQGGGLLGLLRSAGQSARGLMARATQFHDSGTLTSNQVLLSGSFSGPSSHDLLLVPRTGGNATLYARNPAGQFAPVALNPALSLADSMVAATRLACGGTQDAVAIAFQNERRPALVQFQQSGATTSFLNNDMAVLQIQTADINADSKTDLLILRNDGSVHVALAQNAACSFAGFSPIATLPSPSTTPTALAVADLNGDGMVDVVGLVGGVVRVFLNRGERRASEAGRFEALPDFLLPAESTAAQLVAGEFRAKGLREILLAVQSFAGNSQLYAIKLDRDGKTLTDSGTMANTQLRTLNIASTDFNQDGLLDVVLFDASSDLMSVTSWRAANTPNTRLYNIGHAPTAVAIGALDADLYPDIAFVVQPEMASPSAVDISVAYAMPTGSLP